MPGAQPGTYALVCASTCTKIIDAGRLGEVQLVPGWYLYIGSAFGPGGLAARIEHHRRIASRPHWHIDYLRLHTCLEAVWFTYDPKPREHLWAKVAQTGMKGLISREGFGSSDCACPSHLFQFAGRPLLRKFAFFAHAADRRHAPVHEIGLVKAA